MKRLQHIASQAGPKTARPHSLCRRCGVKLACASALSVAALIAGGCGSTSTASHSSGEAVQTAAAQTEANAQQPTGTITQLPANTVPDRAASTAAHHSASRSRRLSTAQGHAQAKANEHYAPPKITKGSVVQKPFSGTGGNTANDDNPAGKGSRADSGTASSGRLTLSGQPNPCVLVSAARARAFTGKSVTMTEAPLGPTCIYQEAGTKAPVTMAVERLQFSAVKPRLKQLSTVTISGRTAYCGEYGNSVTYVPLSGGRVLDVSAPCEVGVKFAQAALPGLGY